MQDKTQVIPLSKTDFVHTRLTHSLEVSVVGRSLGRLVGKKIIEKYPHLKEVHGYHMNDFGAIVAAASLAHDMEILLLDTLEKKQLANISLLETDKNTKDKSQIKNGRI